MKYGPIELDGLPFMNAMDLVKIALKISSAFKFDVKENQSLVYLLFLI